MTTERADGIICSSMRSKHTASSDPDGVAPSRPLGDAIAWQKLLDFIAPEAGNADQAYRYIRERLVKFFACRGSHDVEELADETLSRVALKLAQADIQAERPAAFVLGVARMIDLEQRRRAARAVPWSDDAAGSGAAASDDDGERMLAALESCLQQLPEAERRLLLRYHEPRGQQRMAIRQAIADELATGLNVLRVRMHRTRLRIEACVQSRLQAVAESGLA